MRSSFSMVGASLKRHMMRPNRMRSTWLIVRPGFLDAATKLFGQRNAPSSDEQGTPVGEPVVRTS